MNNFTWTDLSTFEIDKTQEFYKKIFDWNFHSEFNYFGEKYLVAHQGAQAISGIYTMPEKFVAMNMPSFWMSHIRVENIEETLKKACSVDGSIIEVDITEFGEGKMALVRDPSGAGFTLYEGPDLNGRHNKENHFFWNVHHVEDVSLIKEFYEKTLNWEIIKSDEKFSYKVISKGEHIADIKEMPKEVTGVFQYWIPLIYTENPKEKSIEIENKGGSILAELSPKRFICQDPQGGSFIISNHY